MDVVFGMRIVITQIIISSKAVVSYCCMIIVVLFCYSLET